MLAFYPLLLAGIMMPTPPTECFHPTSTSMQDPSELMFSVNRYLGFRQVEDVTESSDYYFELKRSGEWLYRPLKSREVLQGKLDTIEPISRWLKERLAGKPFDGGDAGHPEVADAPKLYFKLGDQRGDKAGDRAGDESGAVDQNNVGVELREATLAPHQLLAAEIHFVVQRIRQQEAFNGEPLALPIDLQDSWRSQLQSSDAFGQPRVIVGEEALREWLAQRGGGVEELRSHLEQSHLGRGQRKLVVFAWAGSGQDWIAWELTGGDSPRLQYKYRAGQSRDVGRHVVMLSVKKTVQLEQVSDAP